MKLKIAPFAGLALVVGVACTPAGERAPGLEVNADWVEPAVEEIDGTRFVENSGPRSYLAAANADEAVEKTRLLFWDNQAAARDARGIHYVANTEDHEVLIFDAKLRFQGALLPQSSDGDRLDRPLTLSAGPDDLLAAFEVSGNVLIFDRWGRRFQRIDEPPFTYNVGVWGPGSRLVLSRSPYNLAFVAEAPDAPLLSTLDPAHPDEFAGVGQVRETLVPFYMHVKNAGSVATDAEGAMYYAALGRAEVAKFDRDGRPAWVSRRPVEFETPEPRLVPSRNGPATLRLATVQKAIAVGPDGLLYIRSAADAGITKDRLDVLDPENGVWLESASIDTGTAILVGSKGAVFQVPLAALLAERTRERREFRSFDLKTFDGDRLSLADLNGSVTLVSFWASWCGPCRKELPLLDSLSHAIDRADFAVIGINEDVKEEDAREFLEEYGLSFTNLLGRGAMRKRYHYSGLPYSVLLDRDGRVVKDYYGFGGRAAFDSEVAARVMAELGIPLDDRRLTDAVADEAEPAMDHDHAAGAEMHHSQGAARPPTGDAMARLAAYYPAATELGPRSAADVPGDHWSTVADGLALVRSELEALEEKFPDAVSVVRLKALLAFLQRDVEQLSRSADSGEPFVEAWNTHLIQLDYFIGLYRSMSDES